VGQSQLEVFAALRAARASGHKKARVVEGTSGN
jgi:hypothetical protein